MAKERRGGKVVECAAPWYPLKACGCLACMCAANHAERSSGSHHCCVLDVHFTDAFVVHDVQAAASQAG